MARRLRNHQKPRCARRGIANLVPRSRQHSNAAARRYEGSLALDLHQNFAGENVKELLRPLMVMANLRRTRRHEFLNHTQILAFHQMPAIAIISPAIMFGIAAAHATWLGSISRHAFFLPAHQCNLVGMTQPANSHAADPKRELFRHTLATLAYRCGKTVRDAPSGFAEFRAGEGVRTPGQILAHIGDLLDWALSIARGQQKWQDSKPLSWEQEVARFFAALKKFDDFLGSSEPVQAPLGKLFQGPVADALTHVGQIAILRRMAVAPVKGENYHKAEITIGRVGADQAKPKREF